MSPSCGDNKLLIATKMNTIYIAKKYHLVICPGQRPVGLRRC